LITEFTLKSPIAVFPCSVLLGICLTTYK